jgi:hypothetical protein
MALEVRLPSRPEPFSQQSLVHNKPLLPILLSPSNQHEPSLSLSPFNSFLARFSFFSLFFLVACSVVAALYINKFWWYLLVSKRQRERWTQPQINKSHLCYVGKSAKCHLFHVRNSHGKP